ncbi:GNAT family N-acetyltransferase [Actinocorallia lasiicapitis]
MIASLLAAYDDQLRGTGPLPDGVHAEHDGPLLRIVGQYRGFVTAPRDLTGTDLDALIERQRAFFAARGEAVEWKTRAHDLPADLPDRLLAAGFRPEDTETVLIAPISDLPLHAQAPAGVTIRRVHDEAAAHAIAAMETEVWGQDMSFLVGHLTGGLAKPDDFAVFVAEANGRIVSAAWLALREGRDFASLWGGSTLAAWRGRGIYRALVAVRARLGADLGLTYLQVDASDDSRPILRRLGFHPVTTTTPYVWTPET